MPLGIESAIEYNFLLLHLEFNNRLRVLPKDTILQGIDSGAVAAVVISQDSWARQQSDDKKSDDARHCDKTAVGSVINSANSAIPVADAYLEPISYLVAKFVDRGDYVSYGTEYRQLTGMIPILCDVETNERQNDGKVSAVLAPENIDYVSSKSFNLFLLGGRLMTYLLPGVGSHDCSPRCTIIDDICGDFTLQVWVFM